MSDENQTQVSETAVADIQSEVNEALSKDPNVMLAKRVEETLKEAGVDDPSKETPEAKTDETDPEFIAAKQRISKALQERNKVFKERESAKHEAESIKNDAIRLKGEVEATSRQIQQQLAGIRAWQHDLQKNPAQALRAIGIDPEDFIVNIAQAGTPESKLQQQLHEQARKLAEFEQWKAKQAEEYENKQKEAQSHQAKEFRTKIESDFISKASSDTYANVKKALDIGLISKSSLINEGDSIADKFREATGQEASLEDLLEYIDGQFSTAISKLSGSTQVKKATAEVKPNQGGNVGNSLSADEAGERRALSRNLNNADSDERREAAKQAVKAVLKKTAKENQED